MWSELLTSSYIHYFETEHKDDQIKYRQLATTNTGKTLCVRKMDSFCSYWHKQKQTGKLALTSASAWFQLTPNPLPYPLPIIPAR